VIVYKPTKYLLLDSAGIPFFLSFLGWLVEGCYDCYYKQMLPKEVNILGSIPASSNTAIESERRHMTTHELVTLERGTGTRNDL
jgi:hypothetical protein